MDEQPSSQIDLPRYTLPLESEMSSEESDEEFDEESEDEKNAEDEEVQDSPNHLKIPLPQPPGLSFDEDQVEEFVDENNNQGVQDGAIIDPPGPSFICSICQKVCKSGPGLEQHEKSHSNCEKMCHLCGKLFITDEKGYATSKLSSHLWHCKGVKAVKKCTQCNKDFATQRNLRRHILVCSPKCVHCKMTFKTRLGLRLHLCPNAPMLQ